MKRSSRLATLGLALLAGLPIRAEASDAAARPRVEPEDYGRWERLRGSPELSPDGRWIAYEVRRVDGALQVRLRAVADEAAEDRVFEPATAPRFSADGRWLLWTVDVPEEERKELEEAGEPVRTGAGLLDLHADETRELEAIGAADLDATGRFVALHGYPPDAPEGKGADLRLLDLSGPGELTFGNVASYAWSEEGSLLALAIATGRDDGNGVQLYDAATGRLHALDASGSAYRGLSWRDDAADLAVLRSLDEASSDDASAHALLAWTGLDGDGAQTFELGVAEGPIPEDLEIVRHRSVDWSEDGRRVSFGLRPVEEPEEDEDSDADSTQENEPGDGEGGDGEEEDGDGEEEDGGDEDGDEDLPGLQIWHTSDVRIFPRQQSEENRDDERSRLAVWELGGDRVVVVSAELEGEAEVLAGWHHAIERLNSPYPWGRMFGRPYHDLWKVDLATGERKLLLERVRYAWPSAAGRYVLWFDGEDYRAHELATGRLVRLTETVEAEFADQEYDVPTDLTPPYGVGGWLGEDVAVLLYDRFDVWRAALDGSPPVRLSRGAERETYHRVVDLDDDEESLPTDEPLYLRTRGEWSERQGYAAVPPGADLAETLLELDARVSRLTRAEDADVWVFRSERRDDSPDYFVTDATLAAPRAVSRTNPFQDDHAWTRAELFESDSEAGLRLQSFLLYPAQYDPSRRYPMIVYTYEQLSEQVHAYSAPSERNYYSTVAWTQHGYFVLMPDIVYRAREPGVSALEAVRPAVAAVVERGLVDAERVGLIGHSWGGYQATFLPTRTDIFAASVAGAPLTDFVSFMGQIHWRPGIPELDHWETGQARMEVPYWEDPEAHHRNSPIHEVHSMETPLLMAFGDADGVVDWDQGTEFYNFARRAGKQMVLLVYEGEGHGFSEKANQVDYHRRILEWFGHYLKGEPAPAWIEQGIPLSELDDERRRVAGVDEPAENEPSGP